MTEKEQQNPEVPESPEGPQVTEEAMDLVSAVEFQELNNQYRRLAADFDNYRRRSERQNLDLVQRASQSLVNDMLPVLDGFCLALAKGNPEDPFVRGVEMVFQQLNEVLAKSGLQCIPALGCQFDPNHHEAIGFVETDEVEDNTVVDELRQGYLLAGRVIRPAMVRVSKSSKEDDR